MVYYRFGPFVLDPASRLLLREEQPVPVTTKVFETLVVLVENRGRVVTKDELLLRLWPDTTVEEANLAQNISILRKALEDNPKDHRYIATIPGRGYCFVADVAEIAKQNMAWPSANGQPSNEEPSANKEPLVNKLTPPTVSAADSLPPTSSIRSLMLWLAPVLLIAIAAAFYFYFRNISRSPDFYSSVPLTSYAGSEICPSFAPDGERVAFAWDGEKQENFDIYVKQIGEGTILRLTSDPKPDLSPAWSPDGRTIAFLRLDSEEKGEILLMSSVAPGPARSLAAVTAPLTLYPQSKFIAWSPDGKWLVVSDASSYGGVVSLFLLSVETGEKRRITLPPNQYDDVDPAFSLDGRHLAFARYTGGGGASSDLYVLNLSLDLQPEGSPERLTFYNRHLGSPVWASDGLSILFTRTELAGNHAIWRINLTGRKIEPLPISIDSSSALDLSRRGRRLVYTRELSNTNVRAVDLPHPKSGHRGSINPRPWGTMGAANPQFSPDGRQVAFQSDSSGTGEIYIADRDGSHARQLTHMGAIVSGFARWSPDGKNIVFHSRPKGLASLYVISAEGGSPRRLDSGEGDDVNPSWSHDGKWVYFTSRETGDVQIWKIPASGGPKIRVTKRGGYVPFESSDRQYLYYCTTENALMRVPLAGGEADKVLPAVAALGSAYALGKQGIYFIRPTFQGSGQELSFLRFATGQVSTFVTIPGSVTFGLALSPDERSILYSQRDQVSSNLMLVENFH
jgi:Tol biopolymer transport system component/DNA-binding winged helix-turn-helix (wHTH) protein